ncbi:MAG: UPF0236 family protein [Elusimicrobiota bacterium]
MKEILLKDEVKVKLTGTDINLLEKEIKTELQELGKRLLEQMLMRIDVQLLLKKTKCECGKRKWRHRGRVKRKVISIVGEVEFSRVKLKCYHCGKIKYPLDEVLNLRENSNMTLGLIEQSLYLATDTVYDKASENMKRLTGIKISGRQIQNIAKEEGERLKAQAQKARAEIFEKNSIPVKEEERNRVFVQVDGTFVKNRNKTKSRSMECKVGIIYSKTAQVSKNRRKILDKRTYATTLGVEGFREEFIAECNRWGVWDAKEILFVGDGAIWIKNICAEDFQNAIYLLDFWHLTGHIAKALGEDHRRASDNWIAEIRETYDAKLLLNRIKSLYARIRDPDRQKKLRDLYSYVKSNEDGINNWKTVNCLGASGAIEKTVDVSVARRFKRRGMSWLNPGLSSLLALRVLKLNGDWESYWRLRGVPL